MIHGQKNIEINGGVLPPSDPYRISATDSCTDMNLPVPVTVYHVWTKQEMHTKLQLGKVKESRLF